MPSAAAAPVELDAGDWMGIDASEMAPTVGATLGAAVATLGAAVATLGAAVGPPPETVTVTTVFEVTVTVAGPHVSAST